MNIDSKYNSSSIHRSAKIREIEEPNKPSKFDSSAQDSIVNKSPLETANPVQHHSVNILINDSKVDGVITPEASDCMSQIWNNTLFEIRIYSRTLIEIRKKNFNIQVSLTLFGET